MPGWRWTAFRRGCLLPSMGISGPPWFWDAKPPGVSAPRGPFHTDLPSRDLRPQRPPGCPEPAFSCGSPGPWNTVGTARRPARRVREGCEEGVDLGLQEHAPATGDAI